MAIASRGPGRSLRRFPEMWAIIRGQLKWTFEGMDPFIAGEGDKMRTSPVLLP